MKGLIVSGVLMIMAAGCSETASVTVEGVVTAVDGDLTTIRSFDVLTVAGETIQLVPAPFGDFAFPPPHLMNHMQTLDPVMVTYTTTEDGVNLAERISDAETTEDG